jgi:hypothetical protein
MFTYLCEIDPNPIFDTQRKKGVRHKNSKLWTLNPIHLPMIWNLTSGIESEEKCRIQMFELETQQNVTW